MERKQYTPLSREDYEEPCCPFTDPQKVTRIPTERIIDRLDSLLDRDDYAAAERHLDYWLAEAEHCGDRRGVLTVANEQIGLFRKTEQREKAFAAIETALQTAEALGLGDEIIMGTTLVNAATAFKAFGKASDAFPLYERAKNIYETLLDPDDRRLGGLYNNMALTAAELGDHPRARALFSRALDVMKTVPGGEAETAITYCNLADLAVLEHGAVAAEDEVRCCLDTAMALLDTPSLPRDGYYAFVCEKCAPVFGYYGYFLYDDELKKRAEAIHEGT